MAAATSRDGPPSRTQEGRRMCRAMIWQWWDGHLGNREGICGEMKECIQARKIVMLTLLSTSNGIVCCVGAVWRSKPVLKGQHEQHDSGCQTVRDNLVRIGLNKEWATTCGSGLSMRVRIPRSLNHRTRHPSRTRDLEKSRLPRLIGHTPWGICACACATRALPYLANLSPKCGEHNLGTNLGRVSWYSSRDISATKRMTTRAAA